MKTDFDKPTLILDEKGFKMKGKKKHMKNVIDILKGGL